MIWDFSTAVYHEVLNISEDWGAPLSYRLKANHESPKSDYHLFFAPESGQCRFCEQHMSRAVLEDPYGAFHNNEALFVSNCPGCGWWYGRGEEERYIGAGESLHRIEMHYGILRKFSPDDIEVPVNEVDPISWTGLVRS